MHPQTQAPQVYMSFLLGCDSGTSDLPCVAVASADACFPTTPPVHAVAVQPPLARGELGREAWGTSPGTGPTAFHKSFDLILAATPWEGCHYLHLTVDTEAQRGQVAVQGNLVERLGWNSRPPDSTNHCCLLLSAPTASGRPGLWALLLRLRNMDSAQENSQVLRADPHVWWGLSALRGRFQKGAGAGGDELFPPRNPGMAV